MNKKKLFGVMASAAMLLNGAPLSVFAEEMVEVGPTGTVTGADATNVSLDSTNFPDNNLLNAIKSQNPLASTAGDVETLDVPSAVQSLEGLQYLTNLKSFSLVNNNFIQSVDLSNNTSLNGGLINALGNSVTNPVLHPSENYTAPVTIINNGVLTSITLPNDEDLTAVVITNNASLDVIDLSPAALLEDAILSNNSLDELDLSKNAYIQYLNASNNELYQLDATNCKQLQILDVAHNQIFEMKVPTAVPNGLDVLCANHNKLASFDISGLKDLTYLDLNNNMLKTIKLGTQSFNYFDVSYNHLASLNLKKIGFNPDAVIGVSPQNLYANSTDAAVNIKDYDSDFNPDQAKLPGDKDFNDNGVFNIPGLPGVGTKAEFTQANTVIYFSVDTNGVITEYKVYLNGSLVPSSDYTIMPNNLIGMTYDEALRTPITITAKSGTTYSGSATVLTANKKKTISSAQDLIVEVEAQLKAKPNKERITVVIDPSVMQIGNIPLVNPTYTVNEVTGTAKIGNDTWKLTFVQDKSDPSGFTWYVTPKEGAVKEISIILEDAGNSSTGDDAGNSSTGDDAGNSSTGDDAGGEESAALESGVTPTNSYYLYNTNQDFPTGAILVSSSRTPSGNINMQVNVVKEDLMNRLYNPNSGEHFYTKDTHEKDVLVSLGWQAEGIGWVAPIESKIPVYRLYNPNAGDHHYTKDVNEKDTLVRIGWNYEGIGWYSAEDGNSSNTLVGYYDWWADMNADRVDGLEVFREYNPNAKAAGAHNYTVSEVENNFLTSIGWLDEGIAWYALK